MFEEIFDIEHNSPEGVHLGFSKTYSNISKKFWMMNLCSRIQDKINACHPCNINKDKAFTFSLPGIKPVAEHPMQIFELDVQGPFNAKPGPKYLLVATDSLSRFKFAKAVSSQKLLLFSSS